MSSSSMSFFFSRLRTGDQQSTTALWQHYFPRLVGLARRVLEGRPLPVLDAEDVAQSAFASFWNRAERGDFADDLTSNDLWRLLARITVRKARRRMARELTAKRGGGCTLRESDLVVDAEAEGGRLDDVLASTSTAEFDLACGELVEKLLDEDMRAIALYRLMGYTNREISQMLQCSERKVERKMQVIRSLWARDAAS